MKGFYWWVGLMLVVALLPTREVRAQLPKMPQQQQDFCAISQKVFTDRQNYNTQLSKLNDIQKAQFPPPPSVSSYYKMQVDLLGKSGAFKDWVGYVTAYVSPGAHTAAIDFQFDCGASNPGLNPSVRFMNENGIILNAAQQRFADQGYYGQPFNNPVVAAVGQLPNDGQRHLAIMSGNLAYGPSGGSGSPDGYYDQSLTTSRAGPGTPALYVARFTSITMIRPPNPACAVFHRNSDGSWATAESIAMSAPNGESVTFSPDKPIRPGETYLGKDLAVELNRDCVSP